MPSIRGQRATEEERMTEHVRRGGHQAQLRASGRISCGGAAFAQLAMPDASTHRCRTEYDAGSGLSRRKNGRNGNYGGERPVLVDKKRDGGQSSVLLLQQANVTAETTQSTVGVVCEGRVRSAALRVPGACRREGCACLGQS